MGIPRRGHVTTRAAVFFDRDGVITEPVPDPLLGTLESPYRPDEVALVPGVAAAIKELHAAGWLLVVVSNQPAAAKGTVTLDELENVHERTVELLATERAAVDAWRYCHHHPRGYGPLGTTCDCRKPAPGMLLAAAAELEIELPLSWMIGDSDSDVEAGVRAGCRTILFEHPGSSHRRSTGGRPTAAVETFTEAVAIIGRYPGSSGAGDPVWSLPRQARMQP